MAIPATTQAMLPAGCHARPTPLLRNLIKTQFWKFYKFWPIQVQIISLSPPSFGAKAGQHMVACAAGKGLLDFAEAGGNERTK